MKPVSILDIGSSKVVCLMGSRAARGGTVVHGTGVKEYSGYGDGAFFDEKDLENAIVSAVKEAEEMSRRRIREVALSVPAPFSRLVISDASIRFEEGTTRITAEHTDDLIDLSLEKVHVPGYRLMHSTPVVFALDGYESAEKPDGKRADEIYAKISHLYVKNDYYLLVSRILKSLSIEVAMSVSTPLSESMLLIPEEERIRPAILIDVGYLHTDISLAENNAITNMTSIDMGGAQFASDLAFGLDIPFQDAEVVKRKYSFLQDEDSDICTIHMPQGAKRVRREVIDLIIEARAEEFSGLISQALERLGVRTETLPVSYLTGGGFSMMRGGAEYLRQTLGLRVKRDRPFMPSMDTPNYASAFGTLEFVLRELHGDEEEPASENNEKKGIIRKVRKIFNK